MRKVLYISPSVIPSRTANSVHVLHQCAGLAAEGVEVTLVARRAVRDPARLPNIIAEEYGICLDNIRLVTLYNPMRIGDQILITIRALLQLIVGLKPELIISRNLYASFFIACVLRWPIVFETHQLEIGVRRVLQRAIVSRPSVVTIVISEKLKELLSEHLGIEPIRTLVLHDAAPDGCNPLHRDAKRAVLSQFVKREISSFAATAGYFGQLSSGRGIEIIEAMACSRPEVLFVVFGGSEADIQLRRNLNKSTNLMYMGFVPHNFARSAMAACEILLMPYQSSVSIGIPDHDTARWMSPMKMFEYLASGSAIISSDLPVLTEVLENYHTALLAVPDDVDSWLDLLDQLVANPSLRSSIGATAHEKYLLKHTWRQRAASILAATDNPGRK